MMHQNLLFQVVVNLQTIGGLEQYRELLQNYQGEDIKIIETKDESQNVPLFMKAPAEN